MAYLLLGLAAGLISGALGLGGGTILVPAFVLLFGYSQHQAQGTALAVMLPPVFLLAVWRYYVAGHVVVSVALIVAAGFLVGGLLGAHLVQDMPPAILKRGFGLFLALIGWKIFFSA